MKILHFSWDTPIPGVGGSTHEWNVAKAFNELGHKVRIVCKKGKNQKKKTDIDGIEIKRMEWEGKLKILKLFAKAPIIAFKEIMQFNPDIIYERYRIFGGYGVIVGKLLRKKTILEVNDPTIDAPYIESRINWFIKTLASLWERFVFLCSDRIVTHHKVMARRANPKKVMVITNGVDTELFDPAKYKRTKWKNKFVCLFVGTFCKWQGYDTIIKTAKEMENYKDVLFVFVGDKRKNTKNTRFLGRLPYDKIPWIIAQSDVCLYLPDVENYKPMKELGFYFSPLKVFEYMAMGKPVIVSDVGNLKKIVKNGVNGYRIKNNLHKLKNKIIYLYKHKEILKRIGNKNKDICRKRYSWREIAKYILGSIIYNINK